MSSGPDNTGFDNGDKGPDNKRATAVGKNVLKVVLTCTRWFLLCFFVLVTGFAISDSSWLLAIVSFCIALLCVPGSGAFLARYKINRNLRITSVIIAAFIWLLVLSSEARNAAAASSSSQIMAKKIEQMQNQIEQKDKELADKDIIIATNAKEIKNLKDRVASLEAQLTAAIEATASTKSTASPLPTPKPTPKPTPAPTPEPTPAPTPTPTPTSVSTAAKTTTSNVTPSTPAPTNNLPLKAICKDDTVSYQDDASKPDYRGMCSGHGGIKQKLGRTP